MPVGRNAPCPCGSGRKYKHCHAGNPDVLPVVSRDSASVSRRSLIAVHKYRNCDGCTACCGPSLRINAPNLFKARGDWCAYLCDGGCSLWGDTLPRVCREYVCNYLLEPTELSVEERPDHVGAVLHQRENNLVHISECSAGGLYRVLANPVWGPALRRHLQAGRTLTASFLSDPYNADSIHMKWFGDALRCELTSCDANGDPILVLMTPVHSREMYSTHFIPNQNYAFDAEVLIEYLGDREAAVLAPSQGGGGARQVRFRIARRQADFLGALIDHLRPTCIGKSLAGSCTVKAKGG